MYLRQSVWSYSLQNMCLPASFVSKCNTSILTQLLILLPVKCFESEVKQSIARTLWLRFIIFVQQPLRSLCSCSMNMRG